MQDEMSARELNERLDLIQSMIVEGRRSTESWGWVFLLWGIAYFVAIAWASWGESLSVWGHAYVSVGSVRSSLAWPVTTISTAIVTLAIGMRKGRPRTTTSLVRAIVSIWISCGIAMFVLFTSLGFTGRLDEHSFISVLAAMLGVANAASGVILRWKAQEGCAIVWWVAAVGACFGSRAQLAIVFLAAVFICEIVFGIYAMVLESRRNRREVVHA